MKKFTKLALTVSLLSVAMASFASAATTVRITGSSAYRAAVTNAVLHLLKSSSGIQAVYTSFGSGTAPSSLGGANQQIIHGFLTSNNTEVYIKTSWSGSLSGLIALTTSANTAQPFLSTSNINTSDSSQNAAAGVGDNSADGPTGGKALVGTDSGTAFDAAQVADVAMSDVFAASTPYNNANLVIANVGLTGAARGGAPTGVVGVVPFTFVGGFDMPSSVTNLNTLQAQALFQDALVLSQLSGLSADSGVNVHAVGRDADSGTRFTAFAETAFSVIGVSNPDPTQYIVNTSGSTATSIELYPGETLFGQAFADGTQGYSSGGNLATALKASGTLTAADNPGQLIGYLGESDAVSAVAGGAHVLSYNGVAYGTQTGTSLAFNRTLIREGVYTFWGYEHMYYNKNSPIASIADAIAHQIGTTDAAVTGEVLANMHVSRSREGAPISHN